MAKKNVLFLLIDSLRADKCLGENRRCKTPTIDALRREGTVFSQAIATTTSTTPSVASIFTGLYPFTHGVKCHFGYKLSSGPKTLAEVFRENGYNTYAEVTGPLVVETGLDRGFDSYTWRPEGESLYGAWGDELTKRLRGGGFKPPWFLFVHFWEIHSPYPVLNGFSNRDFGENTYERAVSSFDHRLRPLVQAVNLEDTVLVLHADHGEKILPNLENLRRVVHKWEKKFKKLLMRVGLMEERLHVKASGHAFHVYDDMVRVPLFFTGGGFPKGKTITHQVRQVDIYPTLVDVLSLGGSPAVEGRSLMPLIRGEELGELPAYLEACGRRTSKRFLRAGYEPPHMIGIRTPRYKYTRTLFPNVSEELYDLERDPGERTNLIARQPSIAQEMRDTVAGLRARATEDTTKMTSAEEDKILTLLKDLGYM